MSTIRDYYENSFGQRLRLGISIESDGYCIEGYLLYDLDILQGFIILYIPGQHTVDFFSHVIATIGSAAKTVTGKVYLPANLDVHKVKVECYDDEIKFHIKYYGDESGIWLSTKTVGMSSVIIIYSETDLSFSDVAVLHSYAKTLNINIMFRANRYRIEKGANERPFAFISYDQRDNGIAKKISSRLTQMLCPIWYDEFSLTIGSNVRENIEDGLKKCKKCVILLSINYISNKKWAKLEFDTIFSRVIRENHNNVFIPIWIDVSENEVYEFCAPLVGIAAMNWSDGRNIDEICRHIYQKVVVA